MFTFFVWKGNGMRNRGKGNMAKRLCAAALLTAVLFAFLSPASAASSKVTGDADGNGSLTAADYFLLKRHILKTFRLNDPSVCDLNGDGVLDMKDYMLLKRKLLPELPPLPDLSSIPRTEGSETNMSSSKTSALTAFLSETSDVAVFYCTLDGREYYAYNTAERFRTASTAKVPFCHWLCDCADRGEVDLNEKLVYNASRLRTGSPVLEKAKDGQTFTVRELIKASVHYSDNTAFRMMIYRFGTKKYASWLRELGSAFVPERFGLGECDAADLGILYLDYARYRSSVSENADLFWEDGIDGKYRGGIAGALPGLTVFHKYGALSPPSEVTYNDAAVVLSARPYVLVIMTKNVSDSGDRAALCKRICGLVNKF